MASLPRLALAASLLLGALHGQQQFAVHAKAGFPSGHVAGVLVLGDVDGDGDLDAFVGNWMPDPQSRLYLNDGRGSFVDATAGRLPLNAMPQRPALGDVDGDGDLDAVVGTATARSRLYQNDGTGTFTDVTVGRLPAIDDAASALALADVDADGDLDLVGGSITGPYGFFLYLNDGRGWFADVTRARLPGGSAHFLAVGDVDGNGTPDIVTNSGTSRLFLNDGKGYFGDASDRLPRDAEAYTTALALIDLDGDAALDVYLAKTRYPYVALGHDELWCNDGRGYFTDYTARLPMNDFCSDALAVVDVDDDGDHDVFVGTGHGEVWSCTEARDLLWLSDGKGRFSDGAQRITAERTITHLAAAGDLDGDGDPDLILCRGVSSRDQLVVYVNRHRQLHTPSPARIGQAFPIDIYSQPGYALGDQDAVLFLATSPGHLPLPPFGTLGLDPATLVLLPPQVIPAATGRATRSLQIPGDPGLIGVTLHSQALILPSRAPQEWRFTNVMADRIDA